MEAIFLSEIEEPIKRVYTNKTIDFLKENAGLDGNIYNKKMLLQNSGRFADTKYIFSTWGIPVLTEEEIKSCLPSLECVFYAAGSVQDFARPFLKSGVRVFSAWTANAVPVAEYTAAQIVLANKGFFMASRLMSGGSYKAAEECANKYSGNFDETVGIIGAGMIGRLVIKKLADYKLKCLVFDPFLPDRTAEELGVKKCSLEEVFESSAVVSNHLANNEQTKGIFNYSLFSRMRPYSTFINTGRGAQVAEDGLIRALSERPDITAVLDVTYPEPPSPQSPFYSLDNCVLTPHIAGSRKNECYRLSEYMKEEFLRYISNKKCLYEVSEEMLKTMA